jgi:minor tail protein
LGVPIAQLFVTVGADISGLSSGLSSASSQIQKFGSQLQSTGRDLSIGLTAPIVGLSTAIVKTGSDFDLAAKGVQKTVGQLGEGATFDQLNQGLIDLSTSLQGGGLNATKLANIAQVAGAMGITGKDALLAFTATVAQASNAIDGLDPTQIAEALGRIATLTGRTAASDFSRLGSSVVALGNDMQGTEAQLIDVATRSAGALSALGVSAQDILGISSAAVAVGVLPESAGTSIQKFFLAMNDAVAGTAKVTPEAAAKIQNLQDKVTDLGNSLQLAQEKQALFGRNTPATEVQATATAIDKYKRELGQAQTELARLQSTQGGATDDLQGFADAAGLTTDQFKALFRENPAKAFEAIIKGLASAQGNPDKLSNFLNSFGTDADGQRVKQLLLSLAKGESDLNSDSAKLSHALDVSNTAFDQNTALQQENAIFMDALAKRWDLFTNRVNAVTFDAFPAFKRALNDAFNFVESNVLPIIKNLVGQFNSLDPTTQRNILLVAGFAAAIGPAVLIVGTLITVLGALLNPISLAIFLIGALALAWVTNWNGIRDKAGEAITAITKFINSDLSLALIAVAIITAIAVSAMTIQLVKLTAQWAVTAALWLANAAKIAAGWLLAALPAAILAAAIALVLIAVSNFRRAWDANFAGMQQPIANLVDQVGNLFDLLSKLPGSISAGLFGVTPEEWKAQADAAHQFAQRVNESQSAIPALQGVADTFDTIDAAGGQFLNGFPELQKSIQGAANQGVVSATPALSAAGVPNNDLLAALQAIQTAQAAATTGVNAPTNNISVAINNPVVPDLATGDAFAKQLQDAIFNTLISSAQGFTPPGPEATALPGQDF